MIRIRSFFEETEEQDVITDEARGVRDMQAAQAAHPLKNLLLEGGPKIGYPEMFFEVIAIGVRKLNKILFRFSRPNY